MGTIPPLDLPQIWVFEKCHRKQDINQLIASDREVDVATAAASPSVCTKASLHGIERGKRGEEI